MSDSSRPDEAAKPNQPAFPPPPGPEDDATQALPPTPKDPAPEAPAGSTPDVDKDSAAQDSAPEDSASKPADSEPTESAPADSTPPAPLPLDAFKGQAALDEAEPTNEYQGLDSEMWYSDSPATFDTANYAAVTAPASNDYLSDEDDNDAARATSVAAGVTAAGLMASASTEEAEASSTRSSGKPSKNMVIATVLAALLGIGGGVILSKTALAPDPTRSEEYLKLASEKSQVDSRAAKGEQEREELEQTISSYEDEESGLNAQQKDQEKEHDKLKSDQRKLKKDRAKLKKDQEKLKKDRKKLDKDIKITSRPASSSGRWKVGDDIPSGTYRTKSGVKQRCIYAVYSDSSYSNVKFSRSIDKGTPTVDLREGDYFTSMGCGTWSKKSK